MTSVVAGLHKKLTDRSLVPTALTDHNLVPTSHGNCSDAERLGKWRRDLCRKTKILEDKDSFNTKKQRRRVKRFSNRIFKKNNL